jgi:hypothetical protein
MLPASVFTLVLYSRLASSFRACAWETETRSGVLPSIARYFSALRADYDYTCVKNLRLMCFALAELSGNFSQSHVLVVYLIFELILY